MKKLENNSLAHLSEECIPVCIRDEEAIRDTIVLQNFNGMSVRIHRSLLPDNQIEICEKEFALIPQSLYDVWFGRARKVLIEKQSAWNWYFYKTHIGFFWEYRELILAEPAYAQLPTPVELSYRATLFSVEMLPGRYIRLGALVRAWTEYPALYTRVCPKCGGTMLLYSFNGSLMTGRRSKSYSCVDCGHRNEHEPGGDFGALRQTIGELTESLAPAPLTADYSMRHMVRALRIRKTASLNHF